MIDMKLESKHLGPYLPYGLKLNCFTEGYEDEVKTLFTLSHSGAVVTMPESDVFLFEDIKPILRPLSELDVDNEIHTPEYISECMYSYVEKLISEHYDVFGLIPKGLAIDINTLNNTI